jgi:GNAT superfamily N-acetyltransferase
MAADLSVVPLTPERWDDLVDLFGPRGADAGCWCMFYRLSSREWNWEGADGRRQQLHAMAGDDPAPGLIAYDGDQAVGWVGLGPRASFERLQRSRKYPALDEVAVWSVVCFFVRRSARSRGVARALLDGALAYAREHGAPGVEANAVEPAARLPAANAYHGTAAMFERAGFRRAREVPTSGPHGRVVMRLEFE